MSKLTRKDLKYYIPMFGTRQLLKRIEQLEAELRSVNSSREHCDLVMYYEARIESLYDAICKTLELEGPILSPEKVMANRQSKTQDSD